MLPVVLALTCSLSYGVSDFLGGIRSREFPVFSVLLVSQGTALAALVVYSAVVAEAPPEGRYLLYAFLAGLVEAVGVAALYQGLSAGRMSIVAAISAGAPAVPVLGALAIGELPGTLQAGGIVLALAGIVMVSTTAGASTARLSTRASVVYGLLAALGFGGFFFGMDAASEGSVHWALLIARITTFGCFAVAILATRARFAIPADRLPSVAVIGALVLLSDACYATATTLGLLSVVAVLSSLYPVVTIFLARFILGERLSALQGVGAAATLAGAAVLSVA